MGFGVKHDLLEIQRASRREEQAEVFERALVETYKRPSPLGLVGASIKCRDWLVNRPRQPHQRRN